MLDFGRDGSVEIAKEHEGLGMELDIGRLCWELRCVSHQIITPRSGLAISMIPEGSCEVEGDGPHEALANRQIANIAGQVFGLKIP